MHSFLVLDSAEGQHKLEATNFFRDGDWVAFMGEPDPKNFGKTPVIGLFYKPIVIRSA